jgi:ribosomal-protein-alanine N-acetyltransferase
MTGRDELGGNPMLRREDSEMGSHGESPGLVRVRPMCVEDIDRVMALSDGVREAPRWPREVYTQILDRDCRPERIVLVAESPATRIAGFAVTSLVPPEAELEAIVVANDARRRGIASRLLEELLAELRKSQITEVILEVRESNFAARAL